MNNQSRLIAAAKRAARKISHTEDIRHQTALDRVANQAGRSTWSAFIADPVAIDRASSDAASEPDFMAMSPDSHLVGAIGHGISIGARALLACPAIAGQPARLVYCSARSREFDHPIDAHGLSVSAMVVSIASAPGIQDGRATLEDGTFAFELDDLGAVSQLRLSLDETLPPVAPPVHDDVAQKSDERRRRERLVLRSKAVMDVSPLPTGIEDHDMLDVLLDLAWRTMQADLHFQPHGTTVDVVLQVGETRRAIHVMDTDAYRTVLGMAKDRYRMDRTETRIPQHGTARA